MSSSGFAAASGVFTIRTCDIPTLVDATRRSTWGKTSRYSAVEPSSTGVGSTPCFQSIDSQAPVSVRICASFRSPPPEKRTGTVATAGSTEPSAVRDIVVSTAIHEPFRSTRCGSVLATYRIEPSG